MFLKTTVYLKKALEWLQQDAEGALNTHGLDHQNNVFHDCNIFGTCLDKQSPRDAWPDPVRDLAYWAGGLANMTPELCKTTMCTGVPGNSSASFYFSVQYSRDCFCDSTAPVRRELRQ
ncbi:hypothetical protein SARC_08540 [Sphaeroforma arctica JP610]|uniref:Uncharacterized protein n=1 Tax=Sphaeroforma arctica JP610 TaxID=667725 RepID=A0A0L0FSW2_9EUKA|nr:hypothetical protein SARC_08540 [Sphaeroforma arctica JP610]KNC79053.1 hypothetical protein SARC_08540 [Sphaeroforma arctica JP610]|eukprot:XP_014152955.1 hypothetical protein SARC_08540 [Sphaeroforma arctica JP610]